MPVKIEVSGEDARHAQREMYDILLGSRDLQIDLDDRRYSRQPTPGFYEKMEQQEIAEAQERIAAVDASPSDPQPAEPKKRGRPAKVKTQAERNVDLDADQALAESLAKVEEPQIRTDPENRIDPESPETVAQDTADEAAEVEAARDPVKPLTLDDVRQAVGEYVKKFGMPATQEDGVKIFVQALGNPPASEPIWKMSILPDDQDVLGKAVAGWKAAIEGNPYGRAANG